MSDAYDHINKGTYMPQLHQGVVGDLIGKFHDLLGRKATITTHLYGHVKIQEIDVVAFKESDGHLYACNAEGRGFLVNESTTWQEVQDERGSEGRYQTAAPKI